MKIICNKDGNRNMTQAELAEYNNNIVNVDTFPERMEDRLSKQNEKLVARNQLLEKLGLSAEQFQLLIGQ